MGNKWGKGGEKVGKSERLILKAVSDNAEITISELSEKIGIGTTVIENNIKKLKDKGSLERGCAPSCARKIATFPTSTGFNLKET